MTHRIPLEDGPWARVGWGSLAVALLVAAVLTGLALVGGGAPAWGLALTLGLAGLYGWCGTGAARMARWGAGELRLEGEQLVVDCPALLDEAVVVSMDEVARVVVDPRPRADRRVAAVARRQARGRSTFHEPSWPVMSIAPSAHWEPGGRATPNLAIDLGPSATTPRVPWSVRLLLRLSGGRYGRYRGPRSGKPMPGLRAVVGDPHAARAVFESRAGLDVPDRDRRYLEPVVEADRRKARRQRLLMAAAVVGALVLVALLAWLAGGVG